MALDQSAALAARLQQAVGLHQQGHLSEAEALYRGILAREPAHFDALQLLGAIANHHQRFDEGARLIGEALVQQPNHAPALYNCGSALLGLRRYEEAVSCFDRAIAARPNYVAAWINRGNAQLAMKRPEDALASYAQALAIDPNSPEAINNSGTVLVDLGRPEEVLAMSDSALAVNPGNPSIRYNRANALRMLKRTHEALAEYDRALAVNPDYPEALTNRGLALQDLGLLDEAIANHMRARAIKADFPNAHLNEAICHLLKGDFEQGLELYEWRWRNKPLVDMPITLSMPRWHGREDVSGKSVLIYAEQGFGDTLQMCRYIPLLAARGARVLLNVPKPLQPLLRGLSGVSDIITEETIPAADFHCPMMSLPLVFATTLATIPATVPYLSAPPAAVAKWRARLGEKVGVRIGIAWSGNRDHPNDRNRSIALRRLMPLLDSGATFVSLQKDIGSDDMPYAGHHALHHYGGEIRDFSDTTALIDLVDLVISVDTATAHLAGAMGKRTFVLLPHFGVDWRWMLNRTDSPWYPTAQLLRQPTVDDWESVIARLVTEVRLLLRRADGISS